MKTLIPGYMYLVTNGEELMIAVHESNQREGNAWLDVHDDSVFLRYYTRKVPQLPIQYPAIVSLTRYEDTNFPHISIMHAPVSSITG